MEASRGGVGPRGLSALVSTDKSRALVLPWSHVARDVPCLPATALTSPNQSLRGQAGGLALQTQLGLRAERSEVMGTRWAQRIPGT